MDDLASFCKPYAIERVLLPHGTEHCSRLLQLSSFRKREQVLQIVVDYPCRQLLAMPTIPPTFCRSIPLAYHHRFAFRLFGRFQKAIYLGTLLCIAFPALSQTAVSLPGTSDSLASTLVAQAKMVLQPGVAVSDVTLTGSALWIRGSERDTGVVTMKVKGADKSRVDLVLASRTVAEIRTNSISDPQCWSVQPNAAFQALAVHNCWTDAAWFFPALTSLVASPNAAITYLGKETRNGIVVDHLRSQRYVSDQKPRIVTLIAKLSAVEYYLDASSLLPVAMEYKTHPTDDLNTDIAVEVRFADYRSVNGVMIPFRVQTFINGGLALDVSVDNVVLNSGLADSAFIPQ